jgi:hypothetical protein
LNFKSADASKNYGHWTEQNEKWYKKWLEDIQSGAQPLAASEW